MPKVEILLLSHNIKDLETLAKRAFGDGPDGNLEEWFSFSEMVSQIKQGRGCCVKGLGDDGELIGFVYAEQESPTNGQEGQEKWVIIITAVEPTASGQGIGTLLLDAIEKQAARLGAKKMFVYTNKDDDQVINFYSKNDYEDAGWIKDYQYGKDNSAVWLLKYL